MEETCRCAKDEERLQRVEEIINQFRQPGALIPVLHEIQDMYGYLPEEALQIVSRELGMSMAEIYGVATFYSFFSLEPKGEHIIRVCMGTACYIKGAQGVLDRLSQELNVPVKGQRPTENSRWKPPVVWELAV